MTYELACEWFAGGAILGFIVGNILTKRWSL